MVHHNFKNDRWHGSVNDGLGRVYYATNDTTYYKGDGGVPHIWRKGNDVSVASLTENGNMRAAAFTVFSDGRIKKDIVDIDDEDGLNKILLVQPKKYKYIDETKGTHTVIGFIAQQIKEVIPEAVQVATDPINEDDEIQDFHYLDKMYIYTLNVCATQELHRIITRQRAVIDSLISSIEALEGV